MARLIVIITFLFLASSAFAKADLTDPTTTCTVIGQMIQDMAIGLGNVITPGSWSSKDAREETTGKAIIKNIPVGRSTQHNKHLAPGGSMTRKAREIREIEEVFKPQTFRFRGAQIWGDAEAVVVTDEISFDLKVSCSLPVNYWALYSGDGTMISSGRMREETSFAVKIKEMFQKPYTLTLNVMYQGIANQVKVEMK